MIAQLGGCSKKEKAAENTETTTETAARDSGPVDGRTYTASMANGTASLMLNPDHDGFVQHEADGDHRRKSRTGTLGERHMPNSVDVHLLEDGQRFAMSMTLNFAAHGDSLAVTNGENVGLQGLVLINRAALDRRFRALTFGPVVTKRFDATGPYFCGENMRHKHLLVFFAAALTVAACSRRRRDLGDNPDDTSAVDARPGMIPVPGSELAPDRGAGS
jgi:hypothetical protein